jgi:hypothetical protein
MRVTKLRVHRSPSASHLLHCDFKLSHGINLMFVCCLANLETKRAVAF